LATPAAVAAYAGRNKMLIGLRDSFNAVRTNLASSLEQQPLSPLDAHSLSCNLHASSSLLIAGTSHEPVYSDAATFLPPVQLGPHQLP